MPKWDAYMEWGVYTVYDNPMFISPHTIADTDNLNNDAPVSSAAVKGEIG